MRRITSDEMVDTWDRLCGMDEGQTDAVVKQFMKEQPALGMYLFATTESLGEQGHKRPVVDLVLAFWLALCKTASRPLRSVNPTEIERAEEVNTMQLQKLAEASEIEWENTVADTFQKYNQRELLGFGIEILMTGNEDNPELAPECIGLELQWIKTVIDCLDQ